MTNLPKNTSIGNAPIIVESTKNSHKHEFADIIGLSDDLSGTVYAEKIDGVSYFDMQDTFISDTENVMEGNLNVLSSSSNINDIINKNEVDNVLISKNIKEYSISLLPSVEPVSTANSIVRSGDVPLLDSSWFTSLSGVSKISVNIDEIETQSNTISEFKINNYNSFRDYSVFATEGHVEINSETGAVTYESPETALAETNDTITISESGTENVTIPVTIYEDASVSLTQIDNGVETPIVDNTITIESNNADIVLEIDNYNDAYNYTISSTSSVLTFSRNGNVISSPVPQQNSTSTTETLIVSRPGSSYTLDIVIEAY